MKQRVFHTHGRMYRRALDIVELFLSAQLVSVALLESPPTNFHHQGPKPGQRDFYPNTWDHVVESLFRRLQWTRVPNLYQTFMLLADWTTLCFGVVSATVALIQHW